MRELQDRSALKGLSFTYLALLGALVFFIVLMGVIFTLLERQDRQNEVYFRLVGEQRFLSRSLVTDSLESARGKEAAFARLKEGRDRFEQALNDQKNGNAALGVSPAPEVVRSQLAELDNRWKPVKADLDTLLAGRESVMAVSNFVPHVGADSPLAHETPVVIAGTLDHPAAADHNQVLVNLDGELPPAFARFERLIEIVGTDDADRLPARGRFRFYRDRGYPLTASDLAAADANS